MHLSTFTGSMMDFVVADDGEGVTLGRFEYLGGGGSDRLPYFCSRALKLVTIGICMYVFVIRYAEGVCCWRNRQPEL